MVQFISKTGFFLFTAILLAIAFTLPLGAQSTSIRLEGTVWNLNDEPLPGAILSAVENSTGLRYEAVSDEDGYYRFLALPPGTYTVTVKAKDFKLDGFKWLKDEDIEDSDELPEPEELATDAIAALESAVKELNVVIAALENGNGKGAKA